MVSRYVEIHFLWAYVLQVYFGRTSKSCLLFCDVKTVYAFLAYTIHELSDDTVLYCFSRQSFWKDNFGPRAAPRASASKLDIDMLPYTAEEERLASQIVLHIDHFYVLAYKLIEPTLKNVSLTDSFGRDSVFLRMKSALFSWCRGRNVIALSSIYVCDDCDVAMIFCYYFDMHVNVVHAITSRFSCDDVHLI